MVRLPHLQSRDNQSEETFLAHSVDKQTHNYDKDTKTTIPPYQL